MDGESEFVDDDTIYNFFPSSADITSCSTNDYVNNIHDSTNLHRGPLGIFHLFLPKLHIENCLCKWTNNKLSKNSLELATKTEIYAVLGIELAESFL